MATLGLRLQRRRAAVSRPRARGDAPLLGARASRRGRSRSGWSASSTSGSASTTCAAGSTGSTGCRTASHELIDYKTGERKTEADLAEDLQLALYRLAAREAWGIEAGTGSYYYVLDAEKVAAPAKPDDAERVERTVLQVGEGVLSQDFEPRPSTTVCGWCDYRLICPAAES